MAVVGLGSNLLVADEGFPGLALKLAGGLAEVSLGDPSAGETWLEAGGGATLAVCLHRARSAGLGGLEFACAIPGTVGGAVWMNAGAYGADLRGVLHAAVVATAAGAEELTPEDLGMEYRRSGLRHGQVVASAIFELEPRPADEIRRIVAELQRQRKEAQPTNKRTFGSVFKNPAHELTAGRLLEACGLRGFRIGGAQISPEARELHRERRRRDDGRRARADRRGTPASAGALRGCPRAGGAADRQHRDPSSRVQAAPPVSSPLAGKVGAGAGEGAGSPHGVGSGGIGSVIWRR